MHAVFRSKNKGSLTSLIAVKTLMLQNNQLSLKCTLVIVADRGFRDRIKPHTTKLVYLLVLDSARCNKVQKQRPVG